MRIRKKTLCPSLTMADIAPNMTFIVGNIKILKIYMIVLNTVGKREELQVDR